ncbi:hypothetical protein FPQ18DRAFT_105568 [Pyronema domesticum]|nr:hypothetical protein FPQ18DRAFT_105568 [Pyronema domesticum]
MVFCFHYQRRFSFLFFFLFFCNINCFSNTRWTRISSDDQIKMAHNIRSPGEREGQRKGIWAMGFGSVYYNKQKANSVFILMYNHIRHV